MDAKGTSRTPSDPSNGRDELRSIARHSLWLTIDRVLSLLGSFAIAAFAGRELGPERFGWLQLALSITTLASPFVLLGTQDVAIRRLSTEADPRLVTRALLAIRAFGAIWAVLACVGLSAVLLQPKEAVLVAILALRLVAHPIDAARPWFLYRLETRALALARAAGIAALGLCLALALSSVAYQEELFALALSAEALATATAVALFFKREDLRAAKEKVAPVARSIASEAWPLALSAIGIVIYMRSDQLMLTWLIGAEANGQYAAAIRISESAYVIPTVIALAAFPRLLAVGLAEASSASSQYMQALLDGLVALSVVVIVVVSLAADSVVDLLFGSDYIAAADVLRIHVWTFLFVSLGIARSRWLVARQLLRFGLAATATGVVLNVGLNFLLIPAMGAEGAAWATVFSYAMAAYISGAFSSRVREIWRQQSKALLLPLRLPWIIHRTSSS